ncbi:MAG: hypothetical protein ACI4NN_02870 [Pyramidobacter sp.]|jgi:hypothetical protein
MKRLLAAFAVLCVLSFSSAEAAGKTKVLTVDPVMELLVRFIGGPYVETASGWSWGEDGSLTAARSVLMAGSGAELPLIALNPAEYEEFMISAHRKGRRSALTEAEKKRSGVQYLFTSEQKIDRWEYFYGDPANLPFTAQRIMDVLAALDPGHYSFYQRRLGEFNARLRSVLISGRGRLKNAEVLCFGGWYIPFFQAWGCRVSVPDEKELALAEALVRAEKPKAAAEIAEKLRKGRVVILDSSLDAKKRAALEKFAGAVSFIPGRDTDLLFFIHHVVLMTASQLDQQKK